MSKNLKDILQQQLEAKGISLKEKEEGKMLEERKVETKEECIELESLQATETVLPTLAVTLVEARERIQILREFVSEMMIEGQDYGMIPGCSKPTLLKPGAEKLCDVFGFSKEVEVVNRLEDWEKGIFHYEVKVSLTSKRTGHLEAEGIGSCNTREKKYASQDPYTLVNTMMKMAKKRSLVDAVLSATRSSNLFTQDMEDLKGMAAPNPTFSEPITKPQIMKIKMLGKELNLSKENALMLLEKDYGVKNTAELSKKQATQLIQQLLAMKEAS